MHVRRIKLIPIIRDRPRKVQREGEVMISHKGFQDRGERLITNASLCGGSGKTVVTVIIQLLLFVVGKCQLINVLVSIGSRMRGDLTS